ncbi:hypothetical protein LNJ05_12980 [Tenacibaculum finnmarkense genomovar ulcerans]|uniref:hypothetical protein n=1 Tax=Tenacibaculum TaxID=104267 RepID=UPI00187B6AF0|nr:MULTISPECIES: hypothetical protein [Tenacibaculum]MBE7686567.1 hypothetical protein [Tenacibaculum piscium]MCD8433677.1 hypothetical protein [Tenacibaculum finnmarkense genomovar ulcerans]
MGKTLRRVKAYREAKEKINGFYDNDSHALIIHYSCESFYDIKEGRTPRITSIAVRYLNSAQTKSFSIHKIAELKNISFNDISENYDKLEKEMLSGFFKFAKEHKEFRWIHWNMRNINYGFEALIHRAEILGAKSFSILDDKKYDLARLISKKYGKNYSGHPRLPSILEMNEISAQNWLNGDEEAKAFDNKEFVRLHQSTLAKVDAMENIIKLTAQEDLKTKSKWKDIYGISPQGLFELAKDHWLYSLILIVISTLLGIIITNLIS